MERTPVESSQMKSIGYDPATQVMEVEFSNGRIYQYDNVPANIHADFMEAKSKGAFLGKHIKAHADWYPFRRMPEPQAKEA